MSLHYLVKYNFPNLHWLWSHNSRLCMQILNRMWPWQTRWHKAKKMKQIHHSTHSVAQFPVIWIIFSQWSGLEATPIAGLIEAISYETLSSSKPSLNGVIFIWYSSVATKKKQSEQNTIFATRLTLSHSLTMPVSVSTFDYISFTLLDPGVKLN